MPSKLEQCCAFWDFFKEITWTRTTLTICLIPFALLLLILTILFVLSAQQPGIVVSNSLVCSSVGRDVLIEGGSAVDAAIATMLCEGIALPNSAGIGGGFTALMFSDGLFDSVVATPAMPQAVQNITEFDDSFADGAKAVGVPGELLGYWEMHKKYGLLSWKRLFKPSIDLCKQGVPITEWLAGILQYNKERIVKSKTMGVNFQFSESENFIAEHRIKFVSLAKTLERIANEGVMPFYKGDIGDSFIEDLATEDGIMVKEDLENYKVLWDNNPPSIYVKNNFKVVTTPLPTSGVLIIFVLNIIKNFSLKANDAGLFWHKTIEAMKHAFGYSALLGDAGNDAEYRESILKTYQNMLNPDFARIIRDRIKDEEIFSDASYYGSGYVPLATKGSANICVLSPRGDAVAATTSIFDEFGAYFASPSTGIIGNNLLVRYVEPIKASPTNRPQPGKRKFAPHCPTIVIRQKVSTPFFIVGASGGPKAATLVITALIKYVLNASSVDEAVNQKYFHNQLYPNEVEYEEESAADIMQHLTKLGHEMVQRDMSYNNYSAATCIGNRLNYPNAKFNDRVGGSAEQVPAKNDLNIILVVIIGGQAAAVVGLMLYNVLHPNVQIITPIQIGDQQTEA